MTFFEPLVMSKYALRNELFISPYCTARYNALKMITTFGVQIDSVATRRDEYKTNQNQSISDVFERND